MFVFKSSLSLSVSSCFPFVGIGLRGLLLLSTGFVSIGIHGITGLYGIYYLVLKKNL
ncbi:unnamed protein product [Brassica napus]|uniref:(rape) hypothetical protein n=1 Tax=Brassica napus TaxID=3708 RepID=A0A817A3E2_BRANA|nr:unnamed protein product [Brassica napus]